jgi:hypothetical protein
MNQFYLVVELLRQRLQANPNVNTVVLSKTDDKDLYKKSIYPLVQINPVSAPMSSSQVSYFTFEIAALDQRDISKAPVKDKFEGNDNLQDNLNITYTIINDLVNWLRIQNNTYGIELSNVTDATPILFNDFNILDGWYMSITLMVPNNQSVC